MVLPHDSPEAEGSMEKGLDVIKSNCEDTSSSLSYHSPKCSSLKDPELFRDSHSLLARIPGQIGDLPQEALTQVTALAGVGEIASLFCLTPLLQLPAGISVQRMRLGLHSPAIRP
jgi:hypothetical protein